MTPKQAVAIVAAHGVVLESAQGLLPSLAGVVAGEPIRGSYWAHPKANGIFQCSRAVRQSADVLVCRLARSPAVATLAGPRREAARLRPVRSLAAFAAVPNRSAQGRLVQVSAPALSRAAAVPRPPRR